MEQESPINKTNPNMALSKDIRNLEDLRMRKAQLKEEISLSRQEVNDQIDSVVNPGMIRKVIVTAAVTAVATFALRQYLLRRRQRSGQEPEEAAPGGSPSLLVQLMPLFQTILGFVLGLLRERLEQQHQERREGAS